MNSVAEPTSVYRYYDANGTLLYVGITSRGAARNGEHNKSKAWWPFVVRQEVDHLADRPAALRRETELIRRYGPPFNVQQNPGYRETQEAYLAVVQAPQTKPGRTIDFYPFRRNADGTGTVLRSSAVEYGGGGVNVKPGLRPCGSKRFGVVSAERLGFLILLHIAGKTPPVVSAWASVRYDQNIKPQAMRIVSLTIEVGAG